MQLGLDLGDAREDVGRQRARVDVQPRALQQALHLGVVAVVVGLCLDWMTMGPGRRAARVVVRMVGAAVVVRVRMVGAVVVVRVVGVVVRMAGVVVRVRMVGLMPGARVAGPGHLEAASDEGTARAASKGHAKPANAHGLDGALDDRGRNAGVDQRRHRHVPRDPRRRLEVEVQTAGAHGTGVRFRVSIDAIRPAPNPLSMFTTATPAAQELNIPRSAATPPKLAPYPTLVGTAMTGRA